MTAIISGMAWIPSGDLSEEQKQALRRSLTVYPRLTSNIAGKATPDPVMMWDEDLERGLFGVPRSYYEKKRTGAHEEIVQVSHGAPMGAFLTSLWTADGPFKEQALVLEKMLQRTRESSWGGFLIQAGCGFGKSNVSIEFAFRLGRRTIILVHKEFLMRQWASYIAKQIPMARIGYVQQDRCDYEDCDFVIGMMQSLARDRDKYPKEVYRAFGLVVIDEVHRCPAASWAGIAPRFEAAWRLGVSATPRRKDGAEAVFFNHVGEILYAARTQTVVPKIRVIRTTTKLEAISRGDYTVAADELNASQITSQLVLDAWRTNAIAEDVLQGVKAGRKIIVVSDRLEHLKDMASRLREIAANVLPTMPTIDFYTGEWFTGEVWETTTKRHSRGEPKLATRTEAELAEAEKAQVLFATRQMVAEAFNVPALDVLVIATPASDVEQEVGRIRRWCTPEKGKCERLCPWRAGICKEKPQPIVVDVVDDDEGLEKKFQRRRAFYRSIGAK